MLRDAKFDKYVERFILLSTEEKFEVVCDINSWCNAFEELWVEEDFAYFLENFNKVDILNRTVYGEVNTFHDLIRLDARGNFETLSWDDWECEVNDLAEDIVLTLSNLVETEGHFTYNEDIYNEIFEEEI